MKPPRGFAPFPLLDSSGLQEKALHYSHRRRVRNGWEYWRRDQPDQVVREVWISDYARCITTQEIKK